MVLHTNAAHGRDGSRMVMQILTPRRYERKLMETVRNLDEKAFIIAYEPRAIHGGFWTKGVRTRKVKSIRSRRNRKCCGA